METPFIEERSAPGGVVAGRGDLQFPADRLDPEAFAVGLDEASHFGSRGSSSRAKKADVNSSGQCNTIRKMTEVCSGEIGPTGNVGCETGTALAAVGDGQSFSEISRAIGHPPGSIFTVIAQTGGYVPAPRRRRAGSLTLAEREEISRGLARGDSLRHIARGLGRARP